MEQQRDRAYQRISSAEDGHKLKSQIAILLLDSEDELFSGLNRHVKLGKKRYLFKLGLAIFSSPMPTRAYA